MGIDHLKQKIQTNTNSGSLVNFSNFRIMAIGLQKMQFYGITLTQMISA